jgi:putative ABC transport system ATP-binding protein
MALVQVANVSKKYRLGNEVVHALKDVSFNVEESVFLAIAGPSGSGKSTLLNLIGCIDTPSSGTIIINGHDVTGKSPDQLADIRARTIGFIFQTFNLLPVLTAAENIEYPLLQFPELGRKERRRRVEHFLQVVELSKFSRHRPNELSGGQRQRVAIARALATHSKIVLADEPTANLDHATGESILQLMRHINQTSGTTFIFSTHDRRVMTMADRLIRIEDGAITSIGQRGSSKWTMVNERRAEAQVALLTSEATAEEVEQRAADVQSQSESSAGELGNDSADVVGASPGQPIELPPMDPVAAERLSRAAEEIRRIAELRIAEVKAAAKREAGQMVAAAMARATKENAAELAKVRSAFAQLELTPLEFAAKLALSENELASKSRARMMVIKEAAVKHALERIAAERDAIDKQVLAQTLALGNAVPPESLPEPGPEADPPRPTRGRLSST